MYKVLIADDEWLIREGLKRTVDWSSVQCEIVAEASNGEQSLQAIRLFKPDLLITDIRMPEMDGLKLAEQARLCHPDLKIIFLTGFDDFAYAQQAIKLKASDYVLKPTNPDELLKAVKRVCGEIDMGRKSVSAEGKLREWIAAGQPLILEKLLHDRMVGIPAGGSEPMLNELLDVSELERRSYRVALAEFGKTHDHVSRDVFWNGLSARIRDQLMATPVRIDNRRVAFIVALSSDNVPRLQEAAQDTDHSSRPIIGLSLVHTRIDTISNAFKEAEAALRMQSPGGNQSVVEYGDITHWSGQVVSTDAENFRQIEAYIQTHYAEDITLTGLAARLNMSEAHLSRLFRKRTGISFIDYVTQIRIEHAKQLLSQPDARIYEVSLAAGYQDARYFSQIFRKLTGETPTEYRKRIEHMG